MLTLWILKWIQYAGDKINIKLTKGNIDLSLEGDNVPNHPPSPTAPLKMSLITTILISMKVVY